MKCTHLLPQQARTHTHTQLQKQTLSLSRCLHARLVPLALVYEDLALGEDLRQLLLELPVLLVIRQRVNRSGAQRRGEGQTGGGGGRRDRREGEVEETRSTTRGERRGMVEESEKESLRETETE